ncbi:MAG: hypothetical protein ABI823_14635 [Bryobacteraceae bacterium]
MRVYILGICMAAVCVAQAPSVDVLKQALEKRLLDLKPDGSTERQVLFQSVQPLAKKGAFYPFEVTAVIRDYGPGYPANRFYGETCVGQINKWIFNLTNEGGRWQVDGRMTVSDSKCTKNPSAGVSSVPLATLSGNAAPRGAVAGANPGAAEFHIGEWACYGTGGRLMAGMGFVLQANGTYLDLDKRGSGRWRKTAAGIAFQGGHLDGQVGRNLKGNHFDLSATVGCEPWR